MKCPLKITTEPQTLTTSCTCFEWSRETIVHLNIQIYQNEWRLPAFLQCSHNSSLYLKSLSLLQNPWFIVCCSCRWMALLCTQCSIQKWWRPSRQEEMRPDCWWWILRQTLSSAAVVSFQLRNISQVPALQINQLLRVFSCAKWVSVHLTLDRKCGFADEEQLCSLCQTFHIMLRTHSHIVTDCWLNINSRPAVALSVHERISQSQQRTASMLSWWSGPWQKYEK